MFIGRLVTFLRLTVTPEPWLFHVYQRWTGLIKEATSVPATFFLSLSLIFFLLLVPCPWHLLPVPCTCLFLPICLSHFLLMCCLFLVFYPLSFCLPYLSPLLSVLCFCSLISFLTYFPSLTFFEKVFDTFLVLPCLLHPSEPRVRENNESKSSMSFRLLHPTVLSFYSFLFIFKWFPAHISCVGSFKGPHTCHAICTS